MPSANPFKGSLDLKTTKWWYCKIINHASLVFAEFFGDGNGFYWAGPVLMGTYRPIHQWCKKCDKPFDEGKKIFVVHRVCENIVQTGLCTIATRIDEEDTFCSEEKLPKFLEWQMEQHQKSQSCANSPQPTG